MAIIYSYPQINLSSISADDLMIISDMNADGRPTKSLTLKNLADFVTSTGTGTGTTNKIIKWSDGPAGLLGDSIMNEDVDKIYVDGQLRIGSSSGASRIQIFHDVLDSDNTFSSGGATGSQIIGRRNELYIENRGASRGDIIFKANNGENNGSVDTYFLLDASMADIGTSAKYTRWPDHSRIVLGNSSNVNSLDFEMYHDGGTGLKNGASNLSITSKGGIFIENETGGEIEIHNNINSDFNIRSEGDIKLKGSGGVEYFRVDSGVGEAIFYKQAQVPLVPTANTHATSKQYVDQQIASIPAGLVFQGNWDANANSPTLASGTGTVGNYYVVSVAGNTDLDGITDWEVGDWAVFVEVGGVDKWDKIDQTFVQGAGATGQVSFWSGINSVTGDNDFFWDNTNKRLGIGTTTPAAALDVVGRIGLNDGNNNVSVGDLAGDALTTGNNNTVVGYYALSAETLGDRNVALGAYALHNQNNTSDTDVYNIAIGYQAGLSVTTGTSNTLIGGLSGDALTTGNNNVALGYSSLGAETKGDRSVAIGNFALQVQNNTTNTDVYNTAVGYAAGAAITSAINNTLIGGLAGDALTTGSDNVAIGSGALTSQLTGNSNVAIGRNAMVQGLATDRNVAIGYFALNTLNYTGDSYNVV